MERFAQHEVNTQKFNRAVYHRFSRLSLPRHTSYPAVPFWKDRVDSSVISRRLSNIALSGSATGFYLHIPFCEKACAYCGCNKLIIPRDHAEADATADRFIEALICEMDGFSQARGTASWKVEQLHWGGGTPTWFDSRQIERVWGILTTGMTFSPRAELSVEIDPRITGFDQLKTLRQLGFNRVSIGVQDFDSRVQQAIQRTQPLSLVEKTVDECRKLGFESVNFDLIYGLPQQNLASMQQTLAQVVKLSPDRIAFYRLALLPNIFKLQRSFRQEDIADDDSILDFMLMAIDVFGAHGWDFIGLDHFAKRTDELATSLKNRTLRRSFQGISTGDEIPILAVGPSAISDLGDLFFQNDSQFVPWAQKVARGDSAVIKSHTMTMEDQMRRWVINQLYCYREVEKSRFQKRFELDFDEHFAICRSAWRELEDLGIVEDSSKSLKVKHLLGWLLLRVVAATMDHYLPGDAWKQGLDSGAASRVG